jgi:integrase
MSVYKDAATGKWFYTFRKDGKQIKKRGFRTKREATLAEARAKDAPLPSKLTVNELYPIWMTKAKGIKESSLANRENFFELYISPNFGTRQVTALSADELAGWFDQLDQVYKRSTIRTIRAHFSSMLNCAVSIGCLTHNPLKDVPAMQDEKKLDEAEKYWEPEEYEEFMKFCTSDQNRIAFDLLWNTGMRVGEACGLQWKNVDLEHRKIKVLSNLVYIKKYGEKLQSPKTRNSVRMIDLPENFAKELADWYQLQKIKDGFCNDYYVLGDIRYRASDTVRSAFRKQVKESGVKYITVHGLRHSHASMLINAELNDTLIAERMGHSVVVLHKIYAHVYKQRRSEFKDTIDKMF